MYISPPNPSPDIPLSVQVNLQVAANEIVSRAVEEVGGVDNVEYPFLESGAERYVFDMGAFVAKFDFGGAGANIAEWNAWHEMSFEQRLWFARPYVRSEDSRSRIVVMEKLIENPFEDPDFEPLVSQIFQQEPWMVEFIYDSRWYNWGYRPGSETPVVLDYGLR
ncbi:hypothetical protein LCGC14_2824600 [marine sediment metagenome]|uniref:Uncharacterized protein n=1 Tax=marine sediment metagenome TaxID=412755 RepID=A0A0F8YFZ0_9ZZZZ